MNALSFGLVLLVPATVALALGLGGWFVLAPPALLFVITPVLDAVLGLDTHNADPAEESARAKNPAYDAWLYLWVPVQLAFLAWGANAVRDASTTLEAIGVTAGVGLMTGAAGITIAHELMHRPTRMENALAELLMLSVSYPHFCVEHVLGHHKHVSTPNDPGSAPRGMSLLRFLPRTLLGSLASAWRLEGARVARAGVTPFGPRDRRMRMPLLLAVVVAGVALALGPVGVAFFLGQSAVAVGLVEIINYVEHYGLARARLPDGSYERVLPRHSWNSAHRLTARYLFNLPRHADHHFLASRPYWKLRHMPDSPQLPAGYGTMVLLAAVPPLWFRVMNPRVDAWNARMSPQSARPPLPAGAAAS